VRKHFGAAAAPFRGAPSGRPRAISLLGGEDAAGPEMRAAVAGRRARLNKALGRAGGVGTATSTTSGNWRQRRRATVPSNAVAPVSLQNGGSLQQCRPRDWQVLPGSGHHLAIDLHQVELLHAGVGAGIAGVPRRRHRSTSTRSWPRRPQRAGCTGASLVVRSWARPVINKPPSSSPCVALRSR